jgi:hypothetical protein
VVERRSLLRTTAQESFDGRDGDRVVLALDPAVAGALIHRGLGDDDPHDWRSGVQQLRRIGRRTLPQQLEERVRGELLRRSEVRHDAIGQIRVVASSKPRPAQPRRRRAIVEFADGGSGLRVESPGEQRHAVGVLRESKATLRVPGSLAVGDARLIKFVAQFARPLVKAVGVESGGLQAELVRRIRQ